MIASAVRLLGLALVVGAVQALPQRACAQVAQHSPATSGPPSVQPVPPPTDSSATATLAATPPEIDGSDQDAVWARTPIISGFREWRPTEGKAARLRTEARIAYDPGNLYVFVRALDPQPDSIRHLLERRDSFTPSDMIWLWIDSFHDRRTGYEFGVNAAGVKMDLAVYNDGNEDAAWDAVWDVATRTDSLGWTAEYRIPLSQLHYPRTRVHSFGIMIGRDVQRYNERYSWPLLRTSRTGFVSQYGTLYGMNDLQTPRRMEAMPYVVARNESKIIDNAFDRGSELAVGGDLKYRIASNLTLDATVNPDFGQVEADPAVLNLTAYESFFDERRPFFVAGRGLFRFDVNCNEVNCGGEGLYYSRRIGRTPELAGTYGDTVPLQPVTIVGAGKLIGRSSSGLTVGVLDAVTRRTANRGDTTYSPATNFAVVRATQDLRGGNSTIGAMVTAVNRNSDEWTSPYLASSAYAAALDFRHRLFGNRYEVSGSLDRSRVEASPEAMAAIQSNGVHQFQRPDAGLPLDSSRTVLRGDAEEIKFGKIAGQHLMFQTALQRRSPGFETNDVGFLRRADQTSWSTWVGLFDQRARKYYNRFQLNNNWWQYWTTDGLPLEAAYNTNVHVTLRNNWGWHMGGTIGQLGTTYDDRAARGGPAVRQDPYIAPWLFINGDDRRAVVPFFNVNYFRGSGGRSRSLSFGPELGFKAAGRFSANLSVNWDHSIRDNQWYGNFEADDGIHYTFAHLDQRTTSVTARLNYTFTPDVSLQTYVQPFVSKGTYSNVRELSSTPRADDYDDRYTPYGDPEVTDDPGGFNFKQVQSNLVFRWEYRPGSTLFVVWNHGRQGFVPEAGERGFGGEVRDLFQLHPANTFLIKMSYWLNR
jgi:hypothetical protein